jgi:hypothetical protein
MKRGLLRAWLSFRWGVFVSRFFQFLRTPRWDAVWTPYAMPPGPPILFIHMPKTAGTSLRRMLQSSLGMHAVYPSDKDLARRVDRQYPWQAEILENYSSLRRYFVLAGHFLAAFADQLPVRHRTAVFLRCPVQRSLSLLAHFSKTTGRPPHQLIDDQEIVERHIRNFQTRILGSTDDTPTAECAGRVLDHALAKINEFTFVGLTERFQDSCAVFDATFGTTVCQGIRKENVLRPTGLEYEDLIPRILPLVDMDQVLYARASARFHADNSRRLAQTRPMHRAA